MELFGLFRTNMAYNYTGRGILHHTYPHPTPPKGVTWMTSQPCCKLLHACPGSWRNQMNWIHEVQVQLSFLNRATYDSVPSPWNLQPWLGMEQACDPGARSSWVQTLSWTGRFLVVAAGVPGRRDGLDGVAHECIAVAFPGHFYFGDQGGP